MGGYHFLLAACGGLLGTICRYILGKMLVRLTSRSPIPLAIQLINWFGSFGLGLFSAIIVLIPEQQLEKALSLLFGVGFFGAFTTFSTFSVEAVEMLQKRLRYGMVYIFGTLAGCLLFFVLGYALGRLR